MKDTVGHVFGDADGYDLRTRQLMQQLLDGLNDRDKYRKSCATVFNDLITGATATVEGQSRARALNYVGIKQDDFAALGPSKLGLGLPTFHKEQFALVS